MVMPTDRDDADDRGAATAAATVLWNTRRRQCVLRKVDEGYELYLRHEGHTTRTVIAPTEREAIRMAADWYLAVLALPPDA
jgi:hypothetical protein